MGKAHVTALLDQLLDLGADGIGAEAARKASAKLADLPGEYKAAVVVVADFMGGWTNRSRTCVECLFGDADGRTLGFTPRGLSHWAGLVLALHDARPGGSPEP